MTSPATVLDLIEAFRRSKTMFAAAKLGIFDAAPATAAEHAARIGANAGALERLLDACTGLGLLAKTGEAYSNTPVANEYLARSSPRSLRGYVVYSNDVLYPLWSNLEHAVREGTHRWRQTFGLEGPIFDHFFRTEEDMRTFTLGMHGFGMLSSAAVAAAFDLSRFRVLCDLGGATGHLAQAVCERYPQMRAILFDLPRVLNTVTVSGRITLTPGDFFQDALPEADLFALGRILHDWSEEKSLLLLSRIYARLPDGGGLLIAERLLAPEKTGPVPALMQSLNMLVCTEGKERNLAEYTALLQQTGFRSVEGRFTGTPTDAMLAIK